MQYRLIDHTADFGIHVFGRDLKDLFENASLAMSDLITDISEVRGTHKMHFHITGDDWPDLMVNWLREILFFWAGKEQLVKYVEISSLSEYALSARVSYDAYSPERHVIKNEIKAVTYHQIQVGRKGAGWEAKIIFDI